MITPATRSLVIEKEIPYPPEKIWRALTEGALIKEWLMDNDFQPVVGNRFNFRATPMPDWNGIIDGEVLAIEPNKKLSYSWSSMGLNSVVVWTLAATKGGTLVRMEQSGFRPDQEAAYRGANYGWQKFIDGLERVVAGLQRPRVQTAEMEKRMATFSTSREIPATVEQIFAAISDPERLARWWGPAGFSNTFNLCEFKPGGSWSLIMHGPDGKNYRNENVFAEVEPPTKVVVQHISEPKYRLIITLASSAVGTNVSWEQIFESAEIASRLEHIVVPANEQNLERLSSEVLGKSSGG